MKKIAATITVIFIIVIAAIFGTTSGYLDSHERGSNIFPEKTLINGIDCSNLTYEQAEAKITDSWNSRHIQVTCNLNVRSTDFTDFGYTYDLTDHLKKAKRKHLVAYAMNHFFDLPIDIDIPMTVKDYDRAFKKQVVNSSFFNNDNTTKSQDAYVDLNDPDFPIIHQTYGTEPDMEKLFTDLTRSICMGDMIFVFDERKYFIMPEVTANDPELINYQEFCREHLDQKITYELGDETFTISAEQLSDLMKKDWSGKADEKAVAEYVASLAAKYDNIYSERNFTTPAGKNVTVPPGTYGWRIDQEKEIKQLIFDIESHKDVSRDPVFSATGYGEYTRDMGDTYIDVDISEQMVRYYKNGELIFSTECVTGNWSTGTTTDLGAYYILNKLRNVTLRGRNVDDTEYESFVSYWMGTTWTGEGLHDASWRGSFGGSIWTYNGSHGCINIPAWRMPELYEKAEVGIPVAVHY